MPKAANPFDRLAQAEPGLLFLALRKARPATVALVLSHLPKQLTLQVFGKLDDDFRREVLLCLADQQWCDAGTLQDVAITIEDELSEVQRRAGCMRAANILRECDPAVESSMLGCLRQIDTELSRNVGRCLLALEDLAWFDDRQMQSLLRNIDLTTLALGLKRCPPSVVEKLTRNLTPRSLDSLRERSSYLAAASNGEIEAAKLQIVRTARKLL